MSLFRAGAKSHGAERPSVVIELKLIDKFGLPIDPSSAWFALQEAFKNHPTLMVKAAQIKPDKESDASSSEI